MSRSFKKHPYVTSGRRWKMKPKASRQYRKMVHQTIRQFGPYYEVLYCDCEDFEWCTQCNHYVGPEFKHRHELLNLAFVRGYRGYWADPKGKRK